MLATGDSPSSSLLLVLLLLSSPLLVSVLPPPFASPAAAPAPAPPHPRTSVSTAPWLSCACSPSHTMLDTRAATITTRLCLAMSGCESSVETREEEAEEARWVDVGMPVLPGVSTGTCGATDSVINPASGLTRMAPVPASPPDPRPPPAGMGIPARLVWCAGPIKVDKYSRRPSVLVPLLLRLLLLCPWLELCILSARLVPKRISIMSTARCITDATVHIGVAEPAVAFAFTGVNTDTGARSLTDISVTTNTEDCGTLSTQRH